MKDTYSLFDFINSSPTPYHAVENIKRALTERGYTELSEADEWSLADGQGYFVIRGGSSLIAFVASESVRGFNIAASHSDSPAFYVKSLGERANAYSRLDTERYGDPVLNTWFDRPLSLAGRVVVSTEGGIDVRLVSLDKTLVIPSVAPHLTRTQGQPTAPNPATDMLPLYTLDVSGESLRREVAATLGTVPEKILSSDLLLYSSTPAMTAGKDNELVLAPRLDDLACVWASLSALLGAKASSSVPVLAVFNNEEVGSESMMGAASTFLRDTLSRIAGTEGELMRAIPRSFILSCDNAHALHPSHPELSDANNAPRLGGGVAVKYNANHRYTTDAISEGILRRIAERRGITLQAYANRADIRGGSTLGAIATTKVSALAADVGVPQLAMHSSVETAAISDIYGMRDLISALYGSEIIPNAGGYEVK